MQFIRCAAIVIGLVISTAAATPVAAICLGKIDATGAPERNISDATSNAYSALEARIQSDYGPGHRIGSRRSATYTCVKHMGGQPRHIKWKCTLEADVCNNRQAAPRNPAYIARQRNRFVVGEGYATFQSSNWNSCSDVCIGDSQCEIVEFHRPTSKCNLFNNSPRIKRDKDSESIVGIKKW